ncbi:MAG: LysR family transcriptional regulator [Deltaproteobacteria bacterium]|nr:LysR family transcriptional regulator [Deltaproteobacteria bacterium]
MPKTKKDKEQNSMVSGQIDKGLQIKGRLWVECEGQTYLSWGRIALLERIDEHGSVSAAAKSMKMSFSHAWHLIENMNTLAPKPLVEKQAGGRQGGGTWLTPAGKQAVHDFWQLVEKFQHWIEDEHL